MVVHDGVVEVERQRETHELPHLGSVDPPRRAHGLAVQPDPLGCDVQQEVVRQPASR